MIGLAREPIYVLESDQAFQGTIARLLGSPESLQRLDDCRILYESAVSHLVHHSTVLARMHEQSATHSDR